MQPHASSPSNVRPSVGARVVRALFVLLCVATVFKLTLLAMPPEEISPGGLPQHEEWRRGMAAREWMLGPLMPYLDYQQGNFQGGTLLTIGLDVLSFMSLGESPLTMRVPNLLYDWATIVFVFLLVDRLAGRGAAWVAGLLAAIPSPGYAMVGAIAWASHVEGNAFAMALLWFWTRHVFDGRDGPRRAVGLGVLAGVSIWFNYGVVIWLALMLLVEVLRDRRALIRPAMGQRLVGVAIGLLPWWAFNLTHAWSGFGIYGRSASAHFETTSSEVATHFMELFTQFFPHSLYLPEWGGAGRVLEFLLFGLGTVAWLVLSISVVRAYRREREMRPEFVLIGYPILWTVIYTLGSFHGEAWWVNGYRYMLPLHPIAWISTGVLLGRAAPRVRWVTVGVVITIFVVGLAPYLRPDRAHLNATAPGHNTESIAGFLFERAGEQPDMLITAMERVIATREPLEADVVLFTLGNRLLYGSSAKPRRKDKDPALREALFAQARAHRTSLDALHAEAPARYRPYFSALRDGERAWRWQDRASFWRQWDRRGESRPEGAYEH